MQFLAAGWLLLLIPWLVLAAWLWRRRQRQVDVSTSHFWPADEQPSPSRATRAVPPAWVLLALAAMLLCILSLARPTMKQAAPRVVVLIDSHVSIGAKVGSSTLGEQLRDRFERDLSAIGRAARLEFYRPESGRASSFADSMRQPLTARATRAAMESEYERLARESGRVVVLNAQALTLGPDAVRYVPTTIPADRAITRFEASVEPSPQAMIDLADIVEPTTVRLFGPGWERRAVAEPGATRLFVDLNETAGDWMGVLLESADALPTNDAAYLVLEGAWPSLEVGESVPAEVARFAAVYERLRPARPASRAIRLDTRLDPNLPAVVFAGADQGIEPMRVQLPSPTRRGRPVEDVVVDRVATRVPAELEVLVRANGQPVVAVSRGAPRQVWIGFDVGPLLQRAQGVAWLNDWIAFINGEGGPRWSSGRTPIEPSRLKRIAGEGEPADAPGIFADASGALRTANAQAFAWADPASDTSGGLEAALAESADKEATPLAGPLAWMALLLAAASCGLIGRQRRLDGRGGAT